MMFPHRLNLLSPDKYQHLKRMVNFQFVKNLLEVILFFVAIGGIVLLGGQWVLEDYFNKIAAQITAVSNRYGQTNLEIKQINEILIKVEKIQKETYPWTANLYALSQKIPQGIILQNLNFDKNAKKITLQGLATTRDDLIKLKNEVTTLGWVASADIPPDQLTEKTNIPFSLILVLR